MVTSAEFTVHVDSNAHAKPTADVQPMTSSTEPMTESAEPSYRTDSPQSDAESEHADLGPELRFDSFSTTATAAQSSPSPGSQASMPTPLPPGTAKHTPIDSYNPNTESSVSRSAADHTALGNTPSLGRNRRLPSHLRKNLTKGVRYMINEGSGGVRIRRLEGHRTDAEKAAGVESSGYTVMYKWGQTPAQLVSSVRA